MHASEQMIVQLRVILARCQQTTDDDAARMPGRQLESG